MMNTPKLRFPEFKDDGDWEEKKLGEVFERITRKNKENNKNVLTISAQNGLISQEEFFNKSVSAKDVTGYYLLYKNEFAYNKSYSNGYPMGAIKRLNRYEKGVVSTLYICFKRKSDDTDAFLEYYFDSGLLNAELEKITQEGARNHGLLNLNIADFFEKMNLIIPTPTEQQRIAECLSSLDEIIMAQGEKLEGLKQHKKGLMQNLFPQAGETTPRLRFPEFKDLGAWEEKKLGEVCEINPSNNELPNDFIYIDLESVVSGKLLLRKQITKNNAPSRAQRVLEKNDILFQMVRPYQQNNLFFTFNDNCKYVASTGYAQLRAFESDEYLYQLLYTDTFMNKVIQKCTGSNYPAINSSDLSEIKISLPTPTEQKRIAECLSSLDDLITAEGEKLESLKQHKKGLMQGLFV